MKWKGSYSANNIYMTKSADIYIVTNFSPSPNATNTTYGDYTDESYTDYYDSEDDIYDDYENYDYSE